MVNKFVQNVETLCKTLSKIQCIICGLFCEKLKSRHFYVENHAFLPTFPTFSNHFFTSKSPLIISNIFHYSTDPTNTIINNLIERN